MKHGNIQTRLLGDKTVHIDLSGAITGETIDSLREVLIHVLMRQRPPQVVIDLRATSYIDSMAVGALSAAMDTASDLGINLTIRGGNHAILPQTVVEHVPERA